MELKIYFFKKHTEFSNSNATRILIFNQGSSPFFFREKLWVARLIFNLVGLVAAGGSGA